MNNHLPSGNLDGKNYLKSFIPDRYSHNLTLYKKEVGFMDYADLNRWLHGNFDNNNGDIHRFFFLNLCIENLLDHKIVGNAAELGVFRGNSAFLLAKYCRKIHTTCYLFDTFDGFDARDLKGLDANVDANMFTNTSLESVEQLVGKSNTRFVKGYFPESLSQTEDLKEFSLVHIDCDLEKPMIEALIYFYPRMVKGGYIIMHDYSSMQWPGAKNAIDQFFKDKPEYIVPIPDKSGSCVIRKI